MRSQFLPNIPLNELVEQYEQGNCEQVFERLLLPIHEELYKKQDFSFISTLSPGQELFLRYDYVRTQVLQGGWIQLIQNGYVNLLLPLPEMFEQLGCSDISKLIDNVLKVYTLNHDALSKETNVEEFAKLYEEFTEFEALDTEFSVLNEETIKSLVEYALRFPDEFIVL